MLSVLIVDDEPHMIKIVQAYFVNEGFRTYTACDGEAALSLFYEHKLDLAIVDWMMPKMNGIQLCQEMRKHSTLKVILLTAKGEHEDELAALEAGADDYVRKPFDPRVLLLRAKKLLQLEQKQSIGEITVDTRSYKVYRAGQAVAVTKKELLLLKYLLDHKGRILTRQALLDHVWGFDYDGDDRTVDTHIRRLREKIGEDLIRTHRGLGYSLEEPIVVVDERV